jgi:hypothetical protein
MNLGDIEKLAKRAFTLAVNHQFPGTIMDPATVTFISGEFLHTCRHEIEGGQYIQGAFNLNRELYGDDGGEIFLVRVSSLEKQPFTQLAIRLLNSDKPEISIIQNKSTRSN